MCAFKSKGLEGVDEVKLAGYSASDEVRMSKRVGLACGLLELLIENLTSPFLHVYNFTLLSL